MWSTYNCSFMYLLNMINNWQVYCDTVIENNWGKNDYHGNHHEDINCIQFDANLHIYPNARIT